MSRGGGYNRNLTIDCQVKYVKLKDVAAFSEERIDVTNVTKDTFVGVDNLLQNRAGKVKSIHVPQFGKCVSFRPGDILIGNIRPYLKKIWRATHAGGASPDVLILRANSTKIDSSYLYHILSTNSFFAYDMQFAKGTKMPRGDKSKILEYKFILPPLEEQHRIVAILDRFDKLCNDISAGLPAEIEARKKQYEYYRDKLLSFKEASA